MFVIFGNRESIIRQIPNRSIWAEVGVYRGDFSQSVLDICAPSELYLIDNWKFEHADHTPLGGATENFSAFSGKIHWQHFGDDPNATQEQNYQYVSKRFSKAAPVKILRGDSTEMILRLEDHHFDVIYIDANHQYEYVLRDMMAARRKLKPGAIMLLNDFYEGPGGAEQNLGVMGAVNTFVKRHNFQYLAMSYGAFADVAITEDPGSPFVRQFLANLNNSEFQFIGIPDALVPNIRYKSYRKENGELRYVALF